MTTRLYYTLIRCLDREFDATRRVVRRGRRPVRRRARSHGVLSDVRRPAVRHRPARRRARRSTSSIDDDGDDRARRRRRRSPSARACAATIDWPRRFDHMQQHTGQHVLSAAFDRLLGVRTVSFHLGAETSTIDLAREVTPAEIAARRSRGESRRLGGSRRSTIRFVDRGRGARAAAPQGAARGRAGCGWSRSTDFDLSACGGTHVPRTGHDRRHRGRGLGAIQGRDACHVRLRRPRARGRTARCATS